MGRDPAPRKTVLRRRQASYMDRRWPMQFISIAHRCPPHARGGMMSLFKRFVGRRSFLVSLLSASATIAGAQQGIVSGTVTSTAGQPIADATILVLGTSISTTSGQDGKYILRRVPVGTAEMRAIRVGYQEVKRSVRVIDGQTATLDFQMATSIVQMQPIVVTATGEQ